MAAESEFVKEAMSAAKVVLRYPLSIEQGAALFYELTIDNNLLLTVDPKHPVRGASAFQTDLCVFEAKSTDIKIPRVVLEFKTKITTHDILTYSAKARRHKQVYPYLRYGLVASGCDFVPRRFFVHNESLDFFAALNGTKSANLQSFFAQLLKAEVETSRQLENIAFERSRHRLFRMEVETSSPASILT